ncbi:hypothetical protein HZC27_04140 [Candidatus Roizmanbacteria bacterium]|nr:hypothetical protein [Candidatus Roizmanbacteria bacterium]
MAIELTISPFPPIKPGCLFCEPSKSEPTRHLEKWDGWGGGHSARNLAEITLYESDNLRVIPDSFPVRPDGQHVLIVGKKHRTAFAQPELLVDEVAHFLKRLRSEASGEVIYAEHGGGMPDINHINRPDKNMSIHHRHAHVVFGSNSLDPLNYMRDALTREGWSPRDVETHQGNPIEALRELYTGNPYLFFNIGNRGLWVEDQDDRMVSMTTQRHLSTMYGEPVNWKQIPSNPNMANEAYVRFAKLMSHCNGSGLFIPR